MEKAFFHNKIYPPATALLMSFLLTLTGCADHHSAPAPKIIPRDTTITQANAFTDLILDSLAVRHFIDVALHDSTIGADVTNFYNSRNYHLAWFNKEGPTEQAEAFWNLYNPKIVQAGDSTLRDPLLHNEMDSAFDGVSALSRRRLQHAELSLTTRFLQYMHRTLLGKIRPKDANWYIPERRLDLVASLDSFLSGSQKDWKPLGTGFALLKQQLSIYSKIMQAGGWDSLNFGRKILKQGARTSLIPQIKKRLRISGYLTVSDSSDKFDLALERSVKRAQTAYGLQPTGAIDIALIKELNVPVRRRIEQMIINLERLKWMPAEGPDYILVNIPEYKLRVFHDGAVSLAMNIVVGRATNHTVIFSDSLKFVVFSPYWNVPSSITRNEILPGMGRDKQYLQRHNMEITGYNGSIPVIRQRPGAGNALGKVKFVFPNRFNIYFHDTPAKDLFNERQRAFSHGCIRLQAPFELAKLLLTDKPGWTEKKIRDAMNGSTEKWVPLKAPEPVYIVYFTSWVDRNGLLHFAKDIYGHDRLMATHLFK